MSIKGQREERNRRVSELLMIADNLEGISWLRKLIELIALQEEEIQELRRMAHDTHKEDQGWI